MASHSIRIGFAVNDSCHHNYPRLIHRISIKRDCSGATHLMANALNQAVRKVCATVGIAMQGLAGNIGMLHN